MLKKYEAKKTQVFTDGQELADIIQGNFYDADKEAEYFIGEFYDTVYLPKERFSEFFRAVKITKAGQKAKKKYRKAKSDVLYLRLFHGTDDDIIAWLAQFAETEGEKRFGKRNGKSEYIRQLIRQDMQNCDTKQ